MREPGRSVLFLDVDGVLNNEAVFRDQRFGPCPIDHLCLRRLDRVVEASGCDLVLSSSWRGLPILEGKLEAEGVFIVFRDMRVQTRRHEDGSTKRLDSKRGEEIAEWLSRHPEVERYAIVDDDGDMLPEQMPFFVQTTFEHGLLDEHADRLIAILSPTLPAEGSVSVAAAHSSSETDHV